MLRQDDGDVGTHSCLRNPQVQRHLLVIVCDELVGLNAITRSNYSGMPWVSGATVFSKRVNVPTSANVPDGRFVASPRRMMASSSPLGLFAQRRKKW